MFDTTPPPSPVVTLSKTAEGFLKVSWSQFSKGSFREYDIFPSHSIPDDFSIKDPTITSYVDSSYVGGVGTYLVSVANAAGQSSGQATVNTPQAVLFAYHVSDSTVTLVWRKSQYAGAFKNVVITENGNIINTITSPTDTAYSFRLTNAGLGTSPIVTLTIGAKHPYQGYEPFTFTATIDDPKGSPSIMPDQTLYYSQALNAVVGYKQDEGYARIYNAAMKVKDSIYVGSIFSLPYPGKYAYYRNANGNGVVQRDLTDNTIKTFTIGASSSYVLGVVGAANGFVGVECYDASHNYMLEVINMNTNTVIQTDGTYLLSDDGNYYINGQYFYSYNGSQFVFKTYEPVPDLKFRADNSNELIAATTPTDILQGTTGSILRTITPPEDDYTWKAYDPATHVLLYTKEGASKSYLINIDTKTVKTVYGTGVAFINGTLIDSNGHFIKLM